MYSGLFTTVHCVHHSQHSQNSVFFSSFTLFFRLSIAIYLLPILHNFSCLPFYLVAITFKSQSLHSGFATHTLLIRWISAAMKNEFHFSIHTHHHNHKKLRFRDLILLDFMKTFFFALCTTILAFWAVAKSSQRKNCKRFSLSCSPIL